jgi:hypothetical protein
VLLYKFDVPGPGGGPGAPAAAAANQPPGQLNPQPICAIITGNLYNDDKIL